MKLVENWLNGKQNFLVGRILYNQFGKDESLKQLFAKGEKTPGAKEALLKALQELVAPAVKPPEKVVSEKMPESNDAVLQSMHINWKPKYQQMQYLRVQLDNYGDDNSVETIAKCQPICEEILRLEQELIELWKYRDHYQEYGKLPDMVEEAFVIPKDPIALGKLIETLKRNIRRNKQKAAADTANMTYPALVKKYEAQLKMIEG